MPHISIKGRKPKAFAPLIAMAAALVAISLGLAACGGSSSGTTTTGTNAAATGTTTTGTTSTGTTSTGTSSTGTSSTATTTPPGSTSSASSAARAARFATVRTCLSKKGITLPQRSPGAGGFLGGAGGAQLPKGMSRAQFSEALQSCGAGFHGGSGSGKGAKGFHNPLNNPRFHVVLARFAACLRQQGVNVGEPNTSGKGPIFDTKGINTGSPKFKAATAKCRNTLLYALRPNRAHPGTAGKVAPSS